MLEMRNTKRKTKDDFIKDAKKIHDNKYDYSKVEYINQLTKVCIICPKHGEFWQTPKSHLQGHGCRECGNEISKKVNLGKSHKTYSDKITFNTESFILKSKEIHGNKYDYSKVDYKNITTKVCIICPEHGEFWQRPVEHIKQKSGCPQCANISRYNKFVSDKDTFVKRAVEIFHGVYRYDNVNYVNNKTKVLITCPKHGDFLCTPQNHLKGRGCPICKSELYVYENRLYSFLLTFIDKNDIIRQYKADWLSNNKSIDFFIPKYNLGIEHQGAQHFNHIEFLGGEIKYNRTKELDCEKFNECYNNNVILLYFTYEKSINTDNFFTKVYNNETEFKNKISEYIKYE